MFAKAERPRQLALFLLRNLVLYFLLVNSFLQLREQLDPLFQTAAFLAAVLAAVLMERSRLRVVPAVALAAAIPVAAHALFFLVFRAQRALVSAPATDFLFFYFDKDFFPALAAYGVAWLFNFLALRRRGFVFVETGLAGLLLVAVFWSQAGYALTLYPHPSYFAWALAGFVVAEFFVLLLASGRAPRIDGRAVASFAWVLLPLMLVFLVFLLSKYGEGSTQARGGLMKPTMLRFDFTPYVRLESEIRQSTDTVLLFRTEGKADQWLLRRYVLSGYGAAQGFFMQNQGGVDEYSAVVPDSPESFPDPGYRDRQTVRQEYYFLQLDPTSLISLNYPVRVAPLRNWKASSFLRVYRVDSRVMRSPSGPSRVTEQPPMPAGAVRLYTKNDGDEQIHQLALAATANAPGYYAKAAAIERYLRTNYLYSLKPGIAEDGNQLHHFLFVSKKGYCSYFAFAMTLMLRSLGIPARVAVGFYVDPQSEVLNFYQVRAYQAHAWVEVWFGSLGWVEFNPTSSVPAPGEDFAPFPGPDKERMAQLISEIVKNESGQEEQAGKVSPVVATASRFGQEVAAIARVVARLWYLVLPGLYLLFLLLAKYLPLLPGLFSRDERRRARAAYARCLVTCAGVGRGRRPGESAAEHASRVDRESRIALTPVADLYLKASFAEHFDGEDTASLRPALNGFSRALRRQVAWPRRVLGVVSPRGAARRS